jgi:hypothetical protein
MDIFLHLFCSKGRFFLFRLALLSIDRNAVLLLNNRKSATFSSEVSAANLSILYLCYIIFHSVFLC